MMKTRLISFTEFRRFLNGLGFADKHTEAAWIFHHPTEGLLVFRRYGNEKPVDERDLQSTRKFLDLRGLLESKDFDAFVHEASAPALERVLNGTLRAGPWKTFLDRIHVNSMSKVLSPLWSVSSADARHQLPGITTAVDVRRSAVEGIRRQSRWRISWIATPSTSPSPSAVTRTVRDREHGTAPAATISAAITTLSVCYG